MSNNAEAPGGAEKSSRSKWRWLLFLPLIPVAGFIMMNVRSRIDPTADVAMELLSQCPAAVEALGDDISQPIGWVGGSTRRRSSSSHVRFVVPIAGDDGSGRLDWRATRNPGGISMEDVTLRLRDTADIDVLGCATDNSP